MVEAAQDDCKANPKLFERLLEDAEKPLYPNCKNFTKLSALVKLYNLKGRYGWSDKSFSELLSLLGDMLPINNELPLSMNQKSKGVPAKVMWYFPPIPRFKRMFHSSKIAKDLIWHAQGGEFDGKCVIDHRWPDFSVEPRNLRLAISADGINPHSSLSSRYSCWPVVMITYNLPPWLCMKRKFMMLSLLISGPQQPGNDIDIYLAPLIEDLKTLWETGVEAYDAYQREVFTLRVVLLWTINDFPAYGNLSGCTVKGYFACPICGSETYSHRYLHVRHNLDVRHIKKNVCEIIIEYLSNVDAIGVPSSTNVDHKVGAPIPGGHITKVDCTLLLQAHHYVLENTTIIQPYIEEHMKWLKLNNPRQSKRQKWLQEEHMRTFTHWLWMAHGPTHYVSKYHGYVINGCHYNTKDRDELRVTQNSGVSIVATTMQISSAKDKNPVFGELCFYGIITEIWDLDYTMFRIPVFKCNWVDNKSGVKVDEFGLTLVDFTKMAHKSDPFILASQAKQVFYVQDQLDPRWSVVLSTPERDFSFSAKDSNDFMDNSIEHHPLITTLAQVESFDTMDDSDVICI
ncbi:hypothetical protein AAG906_017723 [Vitis piasezkii]